MKNTAFILASSILLSSISVPAFSQDTLEVVNVQENQWTGKKVVFLGDSITDKKRIGTTKCYWEYLVAMMGINPFVYAINGNQWNGVLIQAETMKDELRDDFDAIIIFAGTNDFNAGIPLGEWFTVAEKETEIAGPDAPVLGKRLHRDFNYNSETFTGRINKVMKFLKSNYPSKQIILLTPIHRGYAKFGNKNIQPQRL